METTIHHILVTNNFVQHSMLIQHFLRPSKKHFSLEKKLVDKFWLLQFYYSLAFHTYVLRRPSSVVNNFLTIILKTLIRGVNSNDTRTLLEVGQNEDKLADFYLCHQRFQKLASSLYKYFHSVDKDDLAYSRFTASATGERLRRSRGQFLKTLPNAHIWFRLEWKER